MSKELLQDLKKAFEVVDYNSYKPTFSPSQLPFCPRKYVIHQHATEDLDAVYSWGYDAEFYTKQGHVIHAVTQWQLGKAGLLFGNWKCCGVTRLHQKSSPCLVCGKWPQYSEFYIQKQLHGLGGYCDGVILEYNAVLEIKTKSSRYINEMTEPIWHEWVMQGSVYVTALNREYGWNLNKVVMLYISRENPNVRKAFVVSAIKNSLDTQVRHLADAKEHVRLRVLPEGICNTPKEGEEKYCIYVPICFRPDLAQKLQLTEQQKE